MASGVLKEELCKLIISKDLLVGVLAGRFRYVDAANLVIQVCQDCDGSTSKYKSEIYNFLKGYGIAEPSQFTTNEFPVKWLGLVTEHFSNAPCSSEDIGDVLERVQREAGHRRPKPQPKRPRFEDCPLANDGVGGNSSDIVLGDGAGASNVSDVALAQQHETYNSYSDLELKLVLVERDKDISKLKSIVQALKEKLLKLEQKLSDMALARVEETDDHQALVAKVRYRVSQYSHVIVFGAYSLALARNKGHAGAGTTLQMCASDDIHGND